MAQKSNNVNKICHAFQFVINAAQVEMRLPALLANYHAFNFFQFSIFFSEVEDIQESFSVY